MPAIEWAHAPSPATSGSHLEWLKTLLQRHSPSTIAETFEKIRALKAFGVHDWALDSIALSKQQQTYAAHVAMRRPSMTARIEQRRQPVEVVCFLRATLMELTDIALLQASRRSQELFRHAAERVHQSRARSNGATLQQAVRAVTVLRDDTKSWRDRVLEARTLLDDISDARVTSVASQIRRALAEDGRRVHVHMAGLRNIDFARRPGDLA